jgi:hypothetical protein
MPSDGISDDGDEPSKRTALEMADSSMTESQSENRRGLLRGVAAATAGLLGFTGSSAAADDPPWRNELVAAAREYGTVADVQRAVSQHAMDLLRGLANDGHIEQADVSALPLTMHRTTKAYVDSSQGVGVFATVSGGETKVKIQIKWQLGDGRRLVLIIEPGTGTSIANLTDETSEDVTVLTADSSAGTNSVSTADCCYDWERVCGHNCNPYDNCSCVDYYYCENIAYTPCSCEVIDYECGDCGGEGC